MEKVYDKHDRAFIKHVREAAKRRGKMEAQKTSDALICSKKQKKNC